MISHTFHGTSCVWQKNKYSSEFSAYIFSFSKQGLRQGAFFACRHSWISVDNKTLKRAQYQVFCFQAFVVVLSVLVRIFKDECHQYILCKYSCDYSSAWINFSFSAATTRTRKNLFSCWSLGKKKTEPWQYVKLSIVHCNDEMNKPPQDD